MKEFQRFLTANPIVKWLLITLLVVLVVFVIYEVYSTITKVKDVAKSNEAVDKANAEIDTTKLTLTDHQISTLVEKIYNALAGWGSDEEAVYKAFEELNTRSDLMALIGKFGIKDGESLQEWLYSDLSVSEINHINSILASNNIDYKF